MRKNTTTSAAPLVILDDEAAVANSAPDLFTRNEPLGVISTRYSVIMPFMVSNNGRTVALIADADDPKQLSEAVAIVERRLGHLSSVIRYRTELPVSSTPNAA